MAEAVYLLCAITSLLCAVLLYRGYRGTGTRVLLWSALCFAGLAANNLLLFVDLVMVPSFSMALARSAVALGAVGVLLFGLIWETP